MAKHHERAVAAFTERARSRSARGVIVVGSVARGTERVDSDVDVYEVVDDATFDAALAQTAVARVETIDADWPGGYVDIKLVSRAVLERAVTDADDATRASLVGARVAFDRDGDLATLIHAISNPEPSYFAQHVRAFAAQFALHADYFLRHGRDYQDALLTRSASVHAANAAARIALAERHQLLRGPKYLLEQLRDGDAGGAELADAISALANTGSADAVERVRSLVPVLVEAGPTITDDALSLFIADNEWAWFTGHAPPEYR